MNRLFVALALYLGLGFFFVINAIVILRGAPMLTAVSKALVALVLFAILGLIAGLVTRVKPAPPGDLGESGEIPSTHDA